MENQTQDQDLRIDPTLVGGPMRDELIRFYNLLAYWTEEHSKYDALKKNLENQFEEAKNVAMGLRAREAGSKGFKAKIQEAYIRDFYHEIVHIDGEEITPSEIRHQIAIVALEESVARHKMNLCQTALDIGRTAVSFDKLEIMRMEATHK
jgi:hypothetical protein